MKDKNLLELVRKASQKDGDAFARLCSLKAREVLYLCTLEMRDRHDGEDAAQEVFIRMQRYITSLAAPEAFNVWLNRLVHSTCSNMKRDTVKHKNSIPFHTFEDAEWQDDSAFSLPQEFMEDGEKRKIVAEIVEELPDKYRRCVVLHYCQSLNYAQVSEVLGITVDAVNNNLRMARKHMRRKLEERLDEPRLTRTWAAAPLVACGPVLAISLRESASLHITPASIAGCLAAAGIPAVGTAPAVAANPPGRLLRGLLLKAVVPVAVAGVIAAVFINTRGRGNAQPESGTANAAVSQAASPGKAGSPAVPAPAVVSGVVTVTDSGGHRTGLADASLALADQSGTGRYTAGTDASGAFQFTEVPLGSYRLLLTVPGWGQPLTVSLGAGDTFTISEFNREGFRGLDINLNLPASLSGHITLTRDNVDLPYDGHYLPGVKMLLLDPLGAVVAETRVHADGSYMFEDLLIAQAGAYTLRVEVDEAKLGMEVEIQDSQIELYPGCHK